MIGRDLERVAVAIGDPTRARMLAALMGGEALTATELALEGRVTPSTASEHLARLVDAELLTVVRQGRHRYFRITSREVAEALEHLSTLPVRRARGPRDPALRAARVCYDHLAGTHGVALHDGLVGRGAIADGSITAEGRALFAAWGLELPPARARPTLRTCLDWSERRFHLGGALGAALFRHMEAQRWIRRVAGSRVVEVTARGAAALAALSAPDAARSR